MVSAEDAGHLLPPVYNKVKGEVPGFYARSETWWLQQSLIDPSSWRNGATSYRFAVSERGREITGYVQYRVQQRWKDHHGASTVKVKELITTDPSSAAGLWAFVINQDLAAEIEASHRPLAEPLLDLLDAPRRVHSRLADSLWVKILDVPAALSARRYWVPGSLTFEVRDPMEERPRRYVLEAGEGESTCRPSRSRPDVSLDAEDLGACYLGRSRFQQLGAAGRLEGSREALQRADAMFTWHPQPWCPEVF